MVAIHAGTDRCYSDLSPRYTPGHQNTDRNAVSSPDRTAHQSNLQEITRQLMVQSAVAGYAVVDDTFSLNVCFCVCVLGGGGGLSVCVSVCMYVCVSCGVSVCVCVCVCV